MSATTYTPREGSVAWKVVRFLQVNRNEQLDADLISAKCECDRRNVHTLLGPAVQAGLLVRSEDEASGELVYTVGDGAALVPTPAETSPFYRWPQRNDKASAEDDAQRDGPAMAPSASERRRCVPFYIDVSTVQIDKDVPMPGRGARKVDWFSLLSKLAVGDSFLLPSAANSAMRKATKEFKDATGKVLSCRTVDDGIRVWRIA